MLEEKLFYRVHEFGNYLSPGNAMKIERSIYSDDCSAESAPYKDKPIAELEALRGETVAAEQAIFERLQEIAKEWAVCAAQTLVLDKAIQYVKMPQAEHTDNFWYENRNGYHEISNATYEMYYRISEQIRYDQALEKSVPEAWYLTWTLNTNAPTSSDNYQHRNASFAGQTQKRFTDKVDMERYLAGRIAAYAHLFAERFPPVPSNYAKRFMINGHLLPGYTVAGDDISKPPKPNRERLLAGKSTPKKQKERVR